MTMIASRLAIDALAAYRLTRLVAQDKITASLRRRLDATVPGVGSFVSCPWCVGFWVSCGVVLARRALPAAWGPVAEVLALSAVTGLVAENL